MDPDDLLAALDPEQREVALACRGPVCVLAGAGTGKTRAITHRIAYAVATGVANPGHVLALTFTVRAAGELRGRLRALGGGAESVRAATFHSAALRQLSYFWPKVIGGRAPKLVESKLPMVREAARDLGLSVAGGALAEAVTEIEWAKVCQTHPDSYVFAAAEAGRSPVGRPGGGRAAVPGLRGAAPGPAADRLRVGPRADGGDPADRARRRPRGARHLPLLHRGRVPGRQPAAEAAARRLAGRARGAVRGGRPAADDLLVHRRHVGVPAGVRRWTSPARRSSGWSATTGPRPRWWRRRTG